MEKKTFNKKWIVGGIIYAVLFIAVILLSNWGVLTTWANYTLRILRPVIIGLTLAYILNPIFVFFERRLFCRFNPPSLRRFVSLLFSYIVLFALVVCLLLMILPQLLNSIITLLKDYEAVITSVSDFINGFLKSINGLLAGITNKEVTLQYVDESKLLQSVTDFLSTVSIGENGNLLDYVNSTELIYDAADILSSAFSIVAPMTFWNAGSNLSRRALEVILEGSPWVRSL